MVALIIFLFLIGLSVGINLAKDGEIHEYSAISAFFGALIEFVLLYFIWNHA